MSSPLQSGGSATAASARFEAQPLRRLLRRLRSGAGSSLILPGAAGASAPSGPPSVLAAALLGADESLAAREWNPLDCVGTPPEDGDGGGGGVPHTAAWGAAELADTSAASSAAVQLYTFG